MKTYISRYLFFILALIVSSPNYSQINPSTGMSARLQALISTTTLYSTEVYKNVQGNPYIDKEFNEGSLLFKDSSRIEKIGLRFNHHSGLLEFTRDENIYTIPNPEDLLQASFNDHIFKYVKYYQGGKLKSAYFEVLVSGTASLLYYRSSIIKREPLPPSEMAGKNYRDYFRTLREYYISKSGEPARIIYKSKKSILGVLSDKEKELKIFINENDLKLRKDKDMIKLIEYYNSLPI